MWLSERNGWRQLFLVNSDGSCSQLTPPTYDVTEIAGWMKGVNSLTILLRLRILSAGTYTGQLSMCLVEMISDQ